MIIGLTGGIASGKSTVAQMLQELGAVVIDADQIARDVVQPHQTAWKKIRERFGETVFLPTGELDRPALGSLIFNDPEAREALNQITHPEIRKEMQRQLKEAQARGEELIVLDIPLLFESKLEYMVDKVLVVYVSEQIQKERLMQRDQVDAEVAKKKMAAQLPLEWKKEQADAYLDNSGTREQTFVQLKEILEDWTG